MLGSATVLTVLVLLVVLVLVAATQLFGRSGSRHGSVAAGHWRAAHYDAGGVTRVVVQKVSTTGVNKLDEHVVAELRRDDPDYDERFLEAMGTARQRQSLFEAEEA